jgi:hypothetical protein
MNFVLGPISMNVVIRLGLKGIGITVQTRVKFQSSTVMKVWKTQLTPICTWLSQRFGVSVEERNVKEQYPLLA